MANVELKSLESLAHRNWRGVDVLDLVATVQEDREWLNYWQNTPELASVMSGWPLERKDSYIFFYSCLLADAGREIERRRAMPQQILNNPDTEIISAIKQAVPVADVIEDYTQVWRNGRDQWKFKCTLHGEDREPSGIIYNSEQKWHCFACQKHGDVFDAVQAWDKCDLPSAIAKLSKRCGIDAHKPLIKRKKLGGIVIGNVA